MDKTAKHIILQSAPDPPTPWLRGCLDSVAQTADSQGYAYRFIGDALFDRLPEKFFAKLMDRRPMAADLARLYWIEQVLAEGCWESVTWIDADVFIGGVGAVPKPSDGGYLLGREVWVQPAKKAVGKRTKGALEARVNIHNAFMSFTPKNPFLAFYRDSAHRMLTRLDGGAPMQLVGPKFLTALHHMIGLPVTDAVGMTSPLVLADVLKGGGAALDLLRAKTLSPPVGYNLCGSLIGRDSDGVVMTEDQITALVQSGIKPLFDHYP